MFSSQNIPSRSLEARNEMPAATSNIAIRVQNLSKCYQLYDTPRDRLKQFVAPRVQGFFRQNPKQYFREFWALKDVSFEVNKGEAVGIVGRNGAGKSTLLQMICGTLSPSTGSVEVNGTVAALLELGSGFNPEFTGRENVYLNASVLGLSHEETNARFDDIAAFADIGNFLDQPAKTYSSGMLMRLAFAVNACIDPEILIVDEALGVGDAPFQSKCFKRLRQMIDNGTSILFVSHDISTVRSICSRALWLKDGHTEMWGDAMSTVKEYEKFCWQAQGVVLLRSEVVGEITAVNQPVVESKADIASSVPPPLLQPNPAFEENRQRSKIGTGDVIVRNFIMVNEAGVQVTSCDYDEKLTFCYLLEACRPVCSDFILGIRLRDLKGNFVYSANDINAIHRIEAAQGDRIFVSAKLRIPLAHQDYVVLTGVFGFGDGTALVDGIYDYSRSVIWEVIEDAAYLKVHPCKIMPLAGPVNASIDLKIEKMN